MLPKIGSEYTFSPVAFIGEHHSQKEGHFQFPKKVTGRIILINPRHRTFTVEYEINGNSLKETFKF